MKTKGKVKKSESRMPKHDGGAAWRVNSSTSRLWTLDCSTFTEQSRNVYESKGTCQNVVARTADFAVRGSSRAIDTDYKKERTNQECL